MKTDAMDHYAFWRAALKAAGDGRKLTREQFGELGGVRDAEPQCGFWKKPGNEKRGFAAAAVAIWFDAHGVQVAFAGDRAVDPLDIWTWCCAIPISEDTYHAVRAGGAWPGEPPAAVAVIGHNSGGATPIEQLRAELAGEAETTTAFLARPVATQEDADKLAVWSRRVGDLAKRAEAERETEKRPHLDAGRAVDAAWRPIIDEAVALTGRLKAAVTPFLQAQKRAAEEVAANARAEAEEAQRKALAASTEEKRRELEANAAKLAAAAEAPAKAKAGRTGAAVSLRTTYVAVIVDFDACYAALKGHPDMRTHVQQLADRACRAKVPLAGVEFKAEERAI